MSEQGDRLVLFLEHLVNDGVSPGVVALVCDPENDLFTYVAGRRQLVPDSLPMSLDTLFDLASVSKVVSTTMVAARLKDLKELDYEDTVGKFLPTSGHYREVTLRQLLTHTGGFIAELRLWDHVAEPSDCLRFILDQVPEYRPGIRYEYSCFGFIVLGAILERIYGDDLSHAAHELVFSPLGMKDTGYNPCQSGRAARLPIAATEYDERSDSVLVGTVHDENARFLGGIAGNAGVFSTAGDISIFLKMLLNNGMTQRGVFLSPERVEEFHTDFTPALAVGRGIGFLLGSKADAPVGRVASPASYGHTGFTGTSVWIDPEKRLAACLLANRVHPSRNEKRLIGLRPQFHDLAFALRG